MNDIKPEDLKRIDDFAQEFATYADQQNGDHSYNESAYTDFKLGAEYEHRYMPKGVAIPVCYEVTLQVFNK